MRLNDKGLARKIGKALKEAKGAMEQQELNRQKAEGHRIEGRKHHEQASIEHKQETVRQLWWSAISEYEKGLVLARHRVTAQPSLVAALEKDLEDAKKHRGLKQRPSLRKVASKIVVTTKQRTCTTSISNHLCFCCCLWRCFYSPCGIWLGRCGRQDPREPSSPR